MRNSCSWPRREPSERVPEDSRLISSVLCFRHIVNCISISSSQCTSEANEPSDARCTNYSAKCCGYACMDRRVCMGKLKPRLYTPRHDSLPMETKKLKWPARRNRPFNIDRNGLPYLYGLRIPSFNQRRTITRGIEIAFVYDFPSPSTVLDRTTTTMVRWSESMPAA